MKKDSHKDYSYYNLDQRADMMNPNNEEYWQTKGKKNQNPDKK